MFEHLWLPCMGTVAAITLCAILFKGFLEKRAGQIAVERKADNDSATKKGTVDSDACTCTLPPVNETATSSGYDYEVFLSFRGPDTRKGITDILYTSLIDAGIRTYRDDEELRVGEEIGPELLQAIDQSNISIPIFSKDYASSVWCLKELVQMVKCHKTRGHKIMPIFYDVAPSEVRYQTGGYGKAFLLHEKKKRYDEETLHEWRAALSAVGTLKGWDLHSENRREGEFTKKLTEEVFKELKKAYLVISDCLVSVDNQVDAIMEMIGAQTNETRIIGLYGMGGIGKTTIAKSIYNQLSNNFKDCCFLSNIHERSKFKGVEYLQKQLIVDILKTKCADIKTIDEGSQIIKDRLSTKKVLLLLDNVDEKDHMRALIGKRDWYGKGSKLIITTTKKKILEVPEVDHLYEVHGMDPNQSLQLFSKHAFRRDYPLDEDINRSNTAIDIAGGLPLAIEVIGSLLSRTKKEKWDVTLEKLKNVPPTEVQNKLKISYEELDVRQKHIFLDIACLFIGYDKDIVIHFWDESKFFPEEAMDVLQNMSLIKIKEDNTVWIHDQLRDFGREMARQESNMKIEKQSRVWDPEEAFDLLKSHEGEKKVESLCVTLDHEQWRCFPYENFMRLSNLRFLEVDGWTAEERPRWHETPSNVLPQLRWLSLHDIPQTFNITNFSMKDLVVVDLSWSRITHTWAGWSHMEVIKNLKVLNLTGCNCLKRTPNFSIHTNLERLILRECSQLVKIDKSICKLKSLVSLDIRHCENLQRLPDCLGGLEALKELRIDYTSIKEIPNCQGMRDLRIFTASHCKIITLPRSIGNLASLEHLSLDGCELLERLPNTIGNLKSLIELDISWTMIKELPNSIENLESLIELDISGTMIKELPISIGNLKNLKVVKMWEIPISKIPNALWTIEKLEEIEARGDQPSFVKIGNCIYRNKSLRILKLTQAHICTLPRLPESLVILHLQALYTFPDLSNLTNLKELHLSFGPRDYNEESYGLVADSMPQWIGKLSKLESLSLHYYYVTTLPTDISLLPQLKALKLQCSNISCLSKLPSSLLSLHLSNSESLCSMDLSNLKKLSSLVIRSAAISEILGLDCLENLQYFLLFDLGQVNILPDLSNLKKLRHLEVQNCGNLIMIEGKLPESLKELEIYSCESLQKLPNLSSLKGLELVGIDDCMKLKVNTTLCFAWGSKANLWENLQELRICGLTQVCILSDLSNLDQLTILQVQRCENLVEIQGELPKSLKELEIYSCESLRKLPDLSSLRGLEKVDIDDCMKLKVEATLCFIRGRKANLWKNLQELRICGLAQVRVLDLSNLDKLTILQVQRCDNLVEIQGKLPESLEELEIHSCESLRKLPDLSSLEELRNVKIEDCMKLNVTAIIGFTRRSPANLWENLGLGQAQTPPSLSNLNKLKSGHVRNCELEIVYEVDLDSSEEEDNKSESEEEDHESKFEREEDEYVEEDDESKFEREEDEYVEEDAESKFGERRRRREKTRDLREKERKREHDESEFEEEAEEYKSEGEDEVWSRQQWEKMNLNLRKMTTLRKDEEECEEEEHEESESESEGENHEYGSEGEEDEYVEEDDESKFGGRRRRSEKTRDLREKERKREHDESEFEEEGEEYKSEGEDEVWREKMNLNLRKKTTLRKDEEECEEEEHEESEFEEEDHESKFEREEDEYVEEDDESKFGGRRRRREKTRDLREKERKREHDESEFEEEGEEYKSEGEDEVWSRQQWEEMNLNLQYCERMEKKMRKKMRKKCTIS